MKGVILERLFILPMLQNLLIVRLRKSLKIKGFLNRIFTKKEIKQGKKLNNKTNFYAKRFAAKEAFAKALGTGFRHNLNFKDIEIMNDKLGKPYYVKTKKIELYEMCIK